MIPVVRRFETNKLYYENALDCNVPADAWRAPLLATGFWSTMTLYKVLATRECIEKRRGAMTRGESLYRLQNLDLELETGQRHVSEIQASLGESEALRQTRQALAAAAKEHRDWATGSRDLELEIESLNNKISASEKRLYSGSVTNPKELGDMQDEVASLKRRRGALEDELLEAMVYSEEAEATLEACRTTLADTEAHWQANEMASKDELSGLEARLAQAQDEREQLRQTIAADDLALYDHIRARYGSVAVVTLRDGVCGFCAVTPSSTKLKRIRSGRELLQCGNCGRILLAL
jgi:predicted  nucleic acid-binding Zn-ribbon protein